MRRSGRVGRRPPRNVLATPRLASWTVSVAVDTRRSAASRVGRERDGPGRLTPVANARAAAVTLGMAPCAASSSGRFDDGAAHASRRRRAPPRRRRPAHDPAPAGVPVRITSPALQRHEPRQVGDQLAEAEEQLVGGVLLDDLAVDARAQAQRCGVDVGRRRPPGRSACSRRGPWTARSSRDRPSGSRGRRSRWPARTSRSRRPSLGTDAARARADDHRDLALEGQQLGAPGAARPVAVPEIEDGGLRKYDGSDGRRPRCSARLR